MDYNCIKQARRIVVKINEPKGAIDCMLNRLIQTPKRKANYFMGSGKVVFAFN